MSDPHMFRKITTIALLFSAFSTLTLPGLSHADQAPQVQAENLPPIVQTKIYGKVTETIDAPGYTYAEVDTGKEKVWAAGPKTPLKVGDMVAFSTKMPMENFHSSSMDRDFPLIYFIDSFIAPQSSAKPMETVAATTTNPHTQGSTTLPIEGITKIEGGHSILEVYADKENLKGKTLHLRAKVTKFNPNIMGKNWAHIRDSSTLDDLTITTSDTMNIGDVVVIEGVLELNKDFGYGYTYPVILENTKVTKE